MESYKNIHETLLEHAKLMKSHSLDTLNHYSWFYLMTSSSINTRYTVLLFIINECGR